MEQGDPNAGGAEPLTGAAAPLAQPQSPPPHAGAPAGPPPPPQLRTVPFPDGSGHIGVPDGWTTSTLHQGVAMLSGPDGASIRSGYRFI